jgi:hypothetical protein
MTLIFQSHVSAGERRKGKMANVAALFSAGDRR